VAEGQTPVAEVAEVGEQFSVVASLEFRPEKLGVALFRAVLD